MSEYAEPTPPFYFRRVWSGDTEMDTVTLMERQEDGSLLITVDIPEADVPAETKAVAFPMVSLAQDGLAIYGRAVIPESAHDRAYAAHMAARGQLFAECFSVQCVDGETGTHPMATVTEISRAEFEAARAKGWR